MKNHRLDPLCVASALPAILFLTSSAWAQESAAPAPAPAEPAPSEAAPAEPSPEEAPSSEEKPAEEAPSEETAAEEKPAEEASSEEQPAEEQPAEEKPAEEQPAEEQPAEEEAVEQPQEEKPIEEDPKEEDAAAAAAAATAAAQQAPPQEPPQQEEPAPEKAMTPEEAAANAEAEEKKEAANENAGVHVYFALNGGLTFGFKSTHGWQNDCPSIPAAGWDPGCSTTSPLGLVLDTRLGMRLGYFGIEIFGMGAGDWSSASLNGQPPPAVPDFATSMQVGRVGGGFGGGLRVMSEPGKAQVSAGVGGGFMLRHVFTSVSSLNGSSSAYGAPLVRADVSVTLFKFLNLGVMGWMEFSKAVTVSPDLSFVPGLPADAVEELEGVLGDITVFEGTQFFLGPYGGITFGG